MEAQLFYRGTERKVQNTFNYESARLPIFKLWMGNHYFTHHCSQTLAVPFSLGRRRSKWQAVGSLEENKIRTQVIYSFILRPWQRSDTVVLELDISPPSSSLPVVLVFCHVWKASSGVRFLHTCNNWIIQHLIECSNGLLVQMLIECSENVARRFEASGRKYKWCTRRNPSLQWLIVVHCTCSKWPLCCCCML